MQLKQMQLITFDREKCTLCGICSRICPIFIIANREKEYPSLASEYEAFCTRCGHCEAICPTNAITINYQVFPPEDDNSVNGQIINSTLFTKYVQSRRSIRIFSDVYAYSENASGYTDSIIALTTFDLMAPSFGLGTCWAGLLHRAVVEYKPLRDAIGVPDRSDYDIQCLSDTQNIDLENSWKK